MTVLIRGEYLGAKRCRVIHVDSGAQFHTDAPKDNNGQGASFSPTDLVATGLGACMMTVMGIVSDRDGIDLSGMHLQVEKHMTTTGQRRIARLPIIIHMPKRLQENERQKLERTAHACPVRHSLHPDIELPVEFLYDI